MNGPVPLETVVQHYAWGSRTLIPALLGLPAPAPDPWAELWVGAHPGGASRLPDGRSLAEVEPDLPYLLKLLSAVEPLSLQAHPDASQAAAGFAREERAGLAFDAPHRTFKDPHAKPEMVVALTPFSALCGFREPAEAERLIRALDCPAVDPLADALGQADAESALRDALTLGMTLAPEARTPTVVAAAAAAAGLAANPSTDGDDARAFAWVARLALLHPGDVGALAPLLLQTVSLQPGEALALPARTLHAYLGGGAIEVMGSSDNVLRGALTGKHVDVAALLDIIDFHAGTVPRITPVRADEGLEIYDCGVAAFRLMHAQVESAMTIPPAGPRLALVTAGEVCLTARDRVVAVRPGHAAYVPGQTGPLTLSGEGSVWIAEPGTMAGAVRQ